MRSKKHKWFKHGREVMHTEGKDILSDMVVKPVYKKCLFCSEPIHPNENVCKKCIRKFVR